MITDPHDPTGDTDVVRQWRETTRSNVVLEQEIADLRISHKRADLEVQRLSRHRKYLLLAIGTIAAVAVVLVWSAAGAGRQEPSPVAPGTGLTSNVNRDQVVAELRAIPPVQPLPCASGRWIAQLGTTLSNDDGRADMQDRLMALRSRSTRPVDLKVAPTPLSCETFSRKDFLVVYAGPFDSPGEALDVCRSFGWDSATAYDIRQCFVVAPDPARDGRYVYPDGSAHSSLPG